MVLKTYFTFSIRLRDNPTWDLEGLRYWYFARTEPQTKKSKFTAPLSRQRESSYISYGCTPREWTSPKCFPLISPRRLHHCCTQSDQNAFHSLWECAFHLMACLFAWKELDESQNLKFTLLHGVYWYGSPPHPRHQHFRSHITVPCGPFFQVVSIKQQGMQTITLFWRYHSLIT